MADAGARTLPGAAAQSARSPGTRTGTSLGCPVHPSASGRLPIGGGHPLAFIARPVRHRERGARARDRRWRSATSRAAAACRSSSRRLRQGQPHVADVVPRARPRRGPRVLGRRQGADRAADPDRHPRAGSGGARPPRSSTSCRFRRFSPGRPTCSSRRRGPAKPSTSRRDSSWRRATCGTSSRRSPREGNDARARHRARRQLRLQQPRRRHARASRCCASWATRSCSTSRTACSCRAPATASPPGSAEYIEPLASAGVAAGVDGVFMEVHEEPSTREERRRERAAARPARAADPEAHAHRRRRDASRETPPSEHVA